MEDLGEILRRLAIRNTSGDRPPLPDVEEGDACDRCGGRGWLTLEAAVGDPNFGRTVACVCRQDDREEEVYSRLLRYSNLGSLARFTFETVEPEGGDRLAGSRDSYERAYQAARDFAEGAGGLARNPWPPRFGQDYPRRGRRRTGASTAATWSSSRMCRTCWTHLRATFSPASDIAYSEAVRAGEVDPHPRAGRAGEPQHYAMGGGEAGPDHQSPVQRGPADRRHVGGFAGRARPLCLDASAFARPEPGGGDRAGAGAVSEPSWAH